MACGQPDVKAIVWTNILMEVCYWASLRFVGVLQGTKLMTPEKARGVWAIYVWCRRTDELVDGPNASRMNPRVSPHSQLIL